MNNASKALLEAQANDENSMEARLNFNAFLPKTHDGVGACPTGQSSRDFQLVARQMVIQPIVRPLNDDLPSTGTP